MIKYFNINENGLSVRCKLYCNDIRSIRDIVIFGHGFGGNRDNGTAQKLFDRLQKRHKDTAVIVFNLPCHGDDARNKLILGDCIKYLNIVIGYAKTRLKAERLFACANSFGAYLVLKLIHDGDNPFFKIALRCPAVNMYEVLTKSIFTEKQKNEIAKGRPVLHGSDRRIKITPEFIDELRDSDITKYDYSGFSDEILLIHGTKDEIVPFGVVQEFAQKNSLSFVPIEACDHVFHNPDHLDYALSQIIGFFFK